MNCCILQGDVFDRLPTIPAGSVDCVVTSPPYYMLRNYLPKGHALKHLELGCEPTPADYVRRMVEVFRLVRACMADHATCWVNLGDSFAGGGNGIGSGKQLTNPGSNVPRRNPPPGIPAGNLGLIPQRFMLAMQDDGWLVRSVIVWRKPSAMPASLSGWQWRKCRVKVKADELHRPNGPNCRDDKARAAAGRNGAFPQSATWSDCPGCKKCEKNDGLVLRRGSWRPTSSYELIIMLAKTSDYYCDGESVKTPAKSGTVSRDKYTRILDDPDEGKVAVQHDHETQCVSGANLRDVWTIPAEPLSEGHYAAFPTELARRCLAAGTSEHGYCTSCGEPWVRVVETTPVGTWHDHDANGEQFGSRQNGRGPRALDGRKSEANAPIYLPPRTLDWRPSCACADPSPRPGLALDPFCGSGRTAIAAGRLGLDFVGCELNPQYVAMANRLVKDDAPLFNNVEE